MEPTPQNSEQSWRESTFLRSLVKFGLGFVVVIFYGGALLHFRYTPDDVFIYLQFAKNILRGGGFAFNAGEPTYGVTSPLWTFLVAAGGLAKLDTYLVAKVLDLVFASLALILFYLLAVEVIRDRLYGFLATFAFSVNLWFVRWAGSGLETSLAVTLVMVAVLYCLRNDYLVAATACSFLTLVRPEGLLLFSLILFDGFLNSVDKRHALKLTLRSTLIYLFIVGPWVVFAYLTFGTVVPNAAAAKSGLSISLEGVTSVALDLGKTVAASSIVEVLLVVSFVVLNLLQKRLMELRLHLLPLLWILLLPLVYIGAEVDVVSRYLLLILPIITVYGFLGLKKILEGFPLTARFGVSAALVVTALILIQNQYLYQRHVKPHIAQFTEGTEECLVPIATWLRENTPANSVVVAPDVGAIGYWSDRKLCDLAGLITPEMRRLRKQGLTYDEIMTQHLFASVCYPDYVIDRAIIPERLTDEQLVPLLTRRFNSLGIAKPGVQFYTLYKVIPGISPKTQVTHGTLTL